MKLIKPVSELRKLVLLCIPTVFDLIATVLMNVGLPSAAGNVPHDVQSIAAAILIAVTCCRWSQSSQWQSCSSWYCCAYPSILNSLNLAAVLMSCKLPCMACLTAGI